MKCPFLMPVPDHKRQNGIDTEWKENMSFQEQSVGRHLLTGDSIPTPQTFNRP